jgi:hypothetical protein
MPAHTRQHHQHAAQMLARLKTDVPEAAGCLGVVGGVNRHRTAALKRWSIG